MEKIKRTASLLLALLMVLSMGVTAFATEKADAIDEWVSFSEKKSDAALLSSEEESEIWEFDLIAAFEDEDMAFRLDSDWQTGWCYTVALTFEKDINTRDLWGRYDGDAVREVSFYPYYEDEPWEKVDAVDFVIVEIYIDANRSAKYTQSSVTFYLGDEEGCTLNFINDVSIIDPDTVIAAAEGDGYIDIWQEGISSFYYEVLGEKVPMPEACAVSTSAFKAIKGKQITLAGEGYNVTLFDIDPKQQGVNFYSFGYLCEYNDMLEEIDVPSFRLRFFDKTPILSGYDLYWSLGANWGEVRTLLKCEDKTVVDYYILKDYCTVEKEYQANYAFVDTTDSAVITLYDISGSLGTFSFSASDELVDHGTAYCEGGENTINWKFGTDGKLIVSGTGIMENPSYYISGMNVIPGVTGAPWGEYAEVITEIYIENGVEGIGDNAFKGLSDVEKITVPESVRFLGWDGVLAQLNIETAGPIGGGYDCEFGWTESIPNDAFLYCVYLKELMIPEGITEIGGFAFYGCEGLSEVVIPKGTGYIGEYAFGACTSLEKIVFEGDAPFVYESDNYDYGPSFDSETVTLYYYEGANGWTSPEWNGYKTVMIEAEPDITYGDVNGDGKINIADANTARRYAAKLITLDETQLLAADVDGNGKVNIADANMIRRYAAKLIDRFPVE